MRYTLRVVAIVISLISIVDAADTAATVATLQRLMKDFPETRFYRAAGRIRSIYGKTFGSGETAEITAENFKSSYSLAFGVEPENLKPVSLLDDKRHIQPVMYDQESNRYKFTLVYYSQFIDDIPVYRADLRLLVRNEPGYPLVLVSSALRDPGDFKVYITPDTEEIEQIQTRFSDPEFPEVYHFTEPQLVIWAGVDNMKIEPRLGVLFTGDNGAPVSERWLYILDFETGEILYKESLLIDLDITGKVTGLATEGIACDRCEDEVAMPMPYAHVNILDGDTAYADSDGNFIIPYVGDDSIIVESSVRGQWFRVFNHSGNDTILQQSAAPSESVLFEHNQLNEEYTRAEVNAYVYSNKIRDYVLTFNPAYPTLQQNEIALYVNRSDYPCPGTGWFDAGDRSISYCRAGSIYPNTAWSSVIYHEYGHLLVDAAGSGQHQYGEGMSDAMSVLLLDNPNIAVGYYGPCDLELRTGDNYMIYPCDGAPHTCGQVISGCVWSTRNKLISSYPTTYREIISNLAINAILLHTGAVITPQITIDYLTLDDDDADLGNGTPHWKEICAGFGAHNMDCPELHLLNFQYEGGCPSLIDPVQQTTIRFRVGSAAINPIAGSARFFYSVNGGSFINGLINEVAPNRYDIVFPALDCMSYINWYLSVESQDMGTVTDPYGASSNTHFLAVAAKKIIALSDDFENDQGWLVENSDGFADGVWQRGMPAGGGDRGDPPVDYDESGQCYLTGNRNGNSDVDGGTTSLISPVFDLSSNDGLVRYVRWYSNDQGDAPHTDIMEVYISNNDGNDWILVETIGPVEQASGGWFENTFWVSEYIAPADQMRLRFDASDLGEKSIVEAAVDAVDIVTFECEHYYICGDVDNNELIEVSDAVFLASYVLAGGPPPNPLEVADVDCDGEVDIADAVYLINYIFADGPEPCAEC